MNDDDTNLHPWIEPELEARLTALVLGEASDFEREELERLVAERPELGLYQKRLKAMHRLLREVATGESAEEQGDWKLAPERREALLARLGADPERNETVVPIPRPKSRTRWGMLVRLAACVAVLSLFLGLMWPASTGILRKVKSPSDGGMSFAYEVSGEERSDRYGRSLRTDLEAPLSESNNGVWVNGNGISVGRTAGTESLAALNLGDDFSTVVTAPAQAGKEVALKQQVENVRGRNAVSSFSLSSADPTPQLEAFDDLRRGVDLSRAETPTMRMPSLAAVDADGDVETRGFRATTNEAALGDLQERELRELDRADRGVSKKEMRDEKRQESEGAGVSVTNGPVALGLDFTPPPAAKPSDPAPVLDESKTATATTAAPAPAAAGRPDFAQTGHGGFGGGSADKEVNGGRLFGSGGTVGLGVAGDVVSGSNFAFVPVPESAGLKDAEAGKREEVTQLQRLSEFSNALTKDGTNAAARRGQEEKEQPVRDAAAQEKLAEVKRESTGDWGKAPVGKAPIDESVDLVGEISAGYASDYILNGNRMSVNEGDRDKADLPAVATPSTDLNTTVFQVPPTFLSTAPAGANVADPFADPVSAGGGPAPAGRVTAKQILESAGISFPEGTTAIYNAETSQLIVRNTAEQTELVEAFVDSVAGSEENEGEHLFTRQFLGGANSLRGFDHRDVGQRSDVDKSVQDILALTPQVGKDLSQDRDRMEMLYQVVPRIVGGGSESGTRVIDSSVSVPDDDAMFPSLDDVIMRSDRSTPAALAETSPSAEPFSTFSLHVSDVSFQLAKSSLASGKWPEVEKIRIEEFVNAFDYGDTVPSMGERVACRIDQGAHPFLQQRNLVRIALRTAEAGRSSGTPLRLTLLLDSSGSMERPDRRATLTRAVATLAGLLGENDRITLVSFARQPRLVADAVAGNEAMKLAETVAALPSEGGTNLEAALELAFEKAREHQEANAQNRIVLLTDGAANLGDAKAESLGTRVEMMRDAGIAFDAAGFGAEGLNDEILEALTRKGDGRYYLLDRPEDAGEAFAEQIAGALRPAAKNVKVQVEFNPDRVKSYKLLGFEKHRLATEDFRNDAVDAAELAAAEAGVAVYQVEPDPAGEGDLGSVSVRFRDLESGEMIERRWSLPHLAVAPSPDQGGDAILLATVASQFAAKLAGGPLGDVVDLGELARLAAALPESERVKELRTMIEQARNLEGLSVSF